MARVEIGDTEGIAPYSVVRRIIEWETGPSCHSVSKSTSQGRPVLSAVESEAFERCLSGFSEEGERDGVKGKPKGFSLPASGEDFAFGESGKKQETGSEQFSPQISFQASARAGVEGEHTPATTQGAGESETANPPKARERAEPTTKREGFYIRRASVNDSNCGGYKNA